MKGHLIKLCNLTLVLSIFMLISGTTSAQTQFIKYKKYLIPINAECQKPKVIITTDIRPNMTGEDDDTQSLIHYLASSYRFDTRGLISTPSIGGGSVGQINLVVNEYNKDRSELIASTGQTDYPTKTYLNQITRQGITTDSAPTYNAALHPGAKLIRDEVAKIVNGGECGPLHVLTWGTVSSLAIALNGNDNVEALSNDQVARNLRVYMIGSSNIGKNSGGTLTQAYIHIRDRYINGNNNSLWLIESNSTFRGFASNSLVNGQDIGQNFLNAVNGNSCLANLLATTMTNGARLKMGDSASVFYLMNGNIRDPLSPSWGGQYQRPNSAKPYYTDLSSPAIPRSTIEPIGADFLTNTNSIYGAWYEDIRGVGGCD